MGLLDEAIREHLELKRRRGADPGEVAREQHEALNVVPEDTAAVDAEQATERGEGDGSELVEGSAGIEADAPVAGQELGDVGLPEAPPQGDAPLPGATAWEGAHVPEADAPGGAPAPEAAGRERAREPLASTLGEETAELDMQSVLDESDDPHELSSPVPPEFTDSAGQEFYSEPESEERPAEDGERSDVYRQAPGQERLSFE